MRPSVCFDRFDAFDVNPSAPSRFAPAPMLPGTERRARTATLALHRLRREQAAVLIGDVAGYSRLIENNDVRTVVRLRQLRRNLIEPAMAHWGGRIVRLAGDGVFSAFADSAAAVGCAIAVQRGLAALERNVPREWRLWLRIGISFGEALVEEDGDLHGPAVNIAARLEALAEPGSVYLTGAAFDQIPGWRAPCCEDLGLHRLRHITEPVRVYRVAEFPARRPTALIEKNCSI